MHDNALCEHWAEAGSEELQDLEKGVRQDNSILGVRWVKVLLRVLWFNFM